MKVRNVSGAVAGLLALVLVSGGCTSGSSSTNGQSGALIPVNVAVLPIVDDIPFEIALTRGLFRQEGLAIHATDVPQSVAAVPSLVRGDVDVIDGANYVSFFGLLERDGVSFRILTDSVPCDPNTNEVLVRRDSPIRSVKDLVGKTVAVNIANDVQTLTENLVTAEDGVNPASIHYVVIHFPNMAAELAKGGVDAVNIVEPFLTATLEQHGAREVLDACQGPTLGMPIAGAVASAVWVKRDPVAARAFIRAMYQAQLLADDNHALVERTAEEWLHESPAVADLLVFGTWPTSTAAVQIQRTADAMSKATPPLIPHPLNVASLIFR